MWQFENLKMILVFFGAEILKFSSAFVPLFAISTQKRGMPLQMKFTELQKNKSQVK